MSFKANWASPTLLVHPVDVILKMAGLIAFTVVAIVHFGWAVGGLLGMALYSLAPYPPRVPRSGQAGTVERDE